MQQLAMSACLLQLNQKFHDVFGTPPWLNLANNFIIYTPKSIRGIDKNT